MMSKLLPVLLITSTLLVSVTAVADDPPPGFGGGGFGGGGGMGGGGGLGGLLGAAAGIANQDDNQQNQADGGDGYILMYNRGDSMAAALATHPEKTKLQKLTEILSHSSKTQTDGGFAAAVKAAMADFPNEAIAFLKMAVALKPNFAKETIKEVIKANGAKSADYIQAALEASDTAEKRRVIAAGASEEGVSLTVINAKLKTVTEKNGSYEVFSVKGSDNTSKITTATTTPSLTPTTGGNYSTPSSSQQPSASGGGGCNKQIASCT